MCRDKQKDVPRYSLTLTHTTSRPLVLTWSQRWLSLIGRCAIHRPQGTSHCRWSPLQTGGYDAPEEREERNDKPVEVSEPLWPLTFIVMVWKCYLLWWLMLSLVMDHLIQFLYCAILIHDCWVWEEGEEEMPNMNECPVGGAVRQEFSCTCLRLLCRLNSHQYRWYVYVSSASP